MTDYEALQKAVKIQDMKVILKHFKTYKKHFDILDEDQKCLFLAVIKAEIQKNIDIENIPRNLSLFSLIVAIISLLYSTAINSITSSKYSAITSVVTFVLGLIASYVAYIIVDFCLKNREEKNFYSILRLYYNYLTNHNI